MEEYQNYLLNESPLKHPLSNLLLRMQFLNCSLYVSICMQRLHRAFEKTVLPDACPKYYRKRSYTYEAGKQKSVQNAWQIVFCFLCCFPSVDTRLVFKCAYGSKWNYTRLCWKHKYNQSSTLSLCVEDSVAKIGISTRPTFERKAFAVSFDDKSGHTFRVRGDCDRALTKHSDQTNLLPVQTGAQI